MKEKTLEERRGLVRVSTGDVPPDLIIRDVDILDVFSKEIFHGNILIHKSWIAHIGEKKVPIDDNTRIIDGNGCVAVPGYIDAHGHADLFYNPSAFADCVIQRGATTVYSDAHDMVNSIGIGGFREVLKRSDEFNVKYLWGVPAAYPPYPDFEGGELYTTDEIRDLLANWKDCVSVSELSPYMRILGNEETILERVHVARTLGKNIEGHTLGASFDRLNTLVAAGITSCHESIREKDLRNRLRLGLYTMIRHSSIRSDFQELCPVMATLPDDMLILVSDGIFAHDLLSKGYMDYVIREAIRYGLRPIDAIRMATLNPARYFKIDSEVGSIAPGRYADILMLDGIENPTPVRVIERGVLKADDQGLVVPKTGFPAVGVKYSPYAFSSIESRELVIEAPHHETVPVIGIIDRTVTKRIDEVLERSGSCLVPSRERDICKIFYTKRQNKAWGRGFLKGFGARIGGIASTIAHETHGLLLLGYDDADMAMAGNKVLEMGGGIVLAERGTIVHSLPLPIGATMSELDMKDLARELNTMNGILQRYGSTLDDPVWTMGFLTFTSIVELRITVSGVYDVRKGAVVF